MVFLAHFALRGRILLVWKYNRLFIYDIIIHTYHFPRVPLLSFVVSGYRTIPQYMRVYQDGTADSLHAGVHICVV